MSFDPNNNIIRLCAEGMELEAKGNLDEAKINFMKAWNEATNNFEKFTAAHYIARHQKSIEDKLFWDKTSLSFALKINDESMLPNFPSLYLNIAKCFEDLGDVAKARENYQKALSFASHLPENGYGHMIKSGIENGLERLIN